MPPIVIAAIIGSIVLTAGLTWVLWRMNKSDGARASMSGQRDPGGVFGGTGNIEDPGQWIPRTASEPETEDASHIRPFQTDGEGKRPE